MKEIIQIMVLGMVLIQAVQAKKDPPRSPRSVLNPGNKFLGGIGCADKPGQCYKLNQEFCWHSYIREICPKSCGLCENVCADQWNCSEKQKLCILTSGKKRCPKTCGRNCGKKLCKRTKVKERCRKTCGICENDTIKPTVTAPDCSHIVCQPNDYNPVCVKLYDDKNYPHEVTFSNKCAFLFAKCNKKKHSWGPYFLYNGKCQDHSICPDYNCPMDCGVSYFDDPENPGCKLCECTSGGNWWDR